MKIGDLVRLKDRQDGASTGKVVGHVFRIDIDWHGAGQALKIYKEVPRGHAIRGCMVDGIGPTHRGKRDRVLILWNMDQWGYSESDELVVIE